MYEYSSELAHLRPDLLGPRSVSVPFPSEVGRERVTNILVPDSQFVPVQLVLAQMAAAWSLESDPQRQHVHPEVQPPRELLG